MATCKPMILPKMNSELDAINKTTIGALLVAILPLPYSYYIFLRWAVMLSASVHLYFGVRRKRWICVAIFAAIAALFNPFGPVHLTKEIWVLLDICAALLMRVGYEGLSKTKSTQAKIN
jgi:hypothetical protein